MAERLGNISVTFQTFVIILYPPEKKPPPHSPSHITQWNVDETLNERDVTSRVAFLAILEYVYSMEKCAFFIAPYIRISTVRSKIWSV